MFTQVRLKSNITATIRIAQKSDTKALIQCINDYISSPFIPVTKEEFQQKSLEEQEAWVEGLNTQANSLLLVAEVDGLIVGNIDLTAPNLQQLQHTATIGMGIRKAWQRKGLGKVLLKQAIHWATHKSSLEMLWLQVFSTNKGGIHLYQQMGFETVGQQPKFVKVAPNHYVDNIIMQKQL